MDKLQTDSILLLNSIIEIAHIIKYQIENKNLPITFNEFGNIKFIDTSMGNIHYYLLEQKGKNI